MGKPIVMGRKTWESFPRRPLPGRLNIVITPRSWLSGPRVRKSCTRSTTRITLANVRGPLHGGGR